MAGAYLLANEGLLVLMGLSLFHVLPSALFIVFSLSALQERVYR